MDPVETELEVAVKIIGEGENKKFFNSLSDALRAFLQEEISQLTLEGQDFFCWFCSHHARIGKQRAGEFEENLIKAPTVSLKIIGWNKEMTYLPRLSSLGKAFQDFFIKGLNGLHGIQIYEQKQNVVVPGLLEMVQNYMIVFGWDDEDPQNILLHLHDIDVKDNHFWRRDFKCYRHECGDFILIPVFGPPHTATKLFSKN